MRYKKKYGSKRYTNRSSSKSYGKSAMQKRKSYGQYIGKKRPYGQTFKKFAEKVMTAASEAKKMTCKMGCGGLSNVPFGNFYADRATYLQMEKKLQKAYITRQNPCLPGLVSNYEQTVTQNPQNAPAFPFGNLYPDTQPQICLVPAYSYVFPLAYSQQTPIFPSGSTAPNGYTQIDPNASLWNMIVKGTSKSNRVGSEIFARYMRMTFELTQDARYNKPYIPDTSNDGSYSYMYNHNRNAQVRIIWFKARNGVQYVANKRNGGRDLPTDLINQSSFWERPLFEQWWDLGLVKQDTTIYGQSKDKQMQIEQDGPFPQTPYGSCDLSAIEVVSDHTETLSLGTINNNSSKENPQAIRICKTVKVMRKLNYADKFKQFYREPPFTTPESAPDIDRQAQPAIDDQDKLLQCAILLPNFSANIACNRKFDAPVWNWSCNVELTYNDS